MFETYPYVKPAHSVDFKSRLSKATESSVMSKSKNSAEIMESILQHLADEVEIDAFHHWISELCDPDSQLVQDANDKYFKKIKEEVELRNEANSMLGKKIFAKH